MKIIVNNNTELSFNSVEEINKEDSYKEKEFLERCVINNNLNKQQKDLLIRCLEIPFCGESRYLLEKLYNDVDFEFHINIKESRTE